MRKLALVASTIGFAVLGIVGPASAAVNPYPPAPTTTLQAQLPPPEATLPKTGSETTGTLQTAGIIVLAGSALVGVAAVRRRKPQAV